MPPPQLPSDHARPRPRPMPGHSSVVPAVKRPPPTSAASVPTKNTQRPASIALTAPSVSAAPRPRHASADLSSPPDRKQLAARSTPSQPLRHGAPSSAASLRPPDRKQLDARPTQPQRHSVHSAAGPRPPSTTAKQGGGALPRRRPAPSSSSEAFMAPRGVQTVRPARRLAPGTAVYVRTTFRPANIKCRILLWLRARVVSSSDAFHCTVKYAADLNDMFAGRIVSMPVDHVRVAPCRSPPNKAAGADPRKMAPIHGRGVTCGAARPDH